MNRPVPGWIQRQLIGHVLGALDEDEARSVVYRLNSDLEFQRGLDAARQQIQLLEEAREDVSPPARLAERTCRFIALADNSHDPLYPGTCSLSTN